MPKNEVGYGARVYITSKECPHVGGCIHEIDEGKKTDLMFHIHSNKIFYVLFGKVKTTLVRDGQINAVEVEKGGSFVIKPGLVYQLQGVEKSVVVEFSDFHGTGLDDKFIVSKGTQVEKLTTKHPLQLSPEMSKEQLEELRAAGEKVLEERAAQTKTTKKKTTKKKTTKKKTSRRSKKNANGE